MENYIKLCEILENPRKNSPVLKYPIGCVVDDMRVIDYFYTPGDGVGLVCECIKCGRVKPMIKSCMDTHSGTTHMACGQFEKTKDPVFHQRWQGMKNRIYNPNYEHYDRYGGRGLTCDYDAFADFYDDMYQSFVEHVALYGYRNTSLDRIDNNLGYVRGNLRWATQKEQVNNSTKMGRPFWAISPTGQRIWVTNQTEFLKQNGLPGWAASKIRNVLNRRVRADSWHGWKFEYDPSVL